ncbi:hypothetical protein ZIOFF_028287 [Zingiber officinale]|uniref:Uncharacterized protein n=1 Tax=Zingiber officinale TaxID=94328 RepID=A0A8J5GRT9_ZINOF|nr:hypothetical protein ZIOFF_028287 [Zingiber officinale]
MGGVTRFLEPQRTPTARKSARQFFETYPVKKGEGTTVAKQEFGEASEFVTLFAQILEKQKAKALTQQPHWEQAQTSSSSPPFLLADADHTLNNGCYQGRATIGGEVEAAEVQTRINGSILPPWMLNHLNG